MTENSKELDEALRKIETKFRVETYLMRLGASEEAARLIASSPDQIKKFSYDGVDLRFSGSDLAVAEDPNAKAHFVGGPFKALFVAPAADKPDVDDHAQPDPALVAAARAGNKTAYSRLARDSFNGDIKALDAALAAKGDGHDQVANGHDDKPLTGFEGSKNPFYKLRKDGKIDKAVEAQIGRMIAAMGHRKVSDIARAAKSPQAPLGLSLTGTPLRP